jgi:hypothetical protein
MFCCKKKAVKRNLTRVEELVIQRFALSGAGYDEARLVYKTNRGVLSPYIFFMKAVVEDRKHDADAFRDQIKRILNLD